jgi:ubiquinone/menaquinone biosynthesis C-methylase UbiE
VPNHHADYPGFRGLGGFVAAATMVVGRRGVAATAAQLVGVTATDAVVDVGCGPGTAARYAARRGARVTGVDPAAVMLRVARAIPGRGSIEWRNGVAEDLGLPDESATVVWALATVHHWTDLERALAEIARVLAPGGRFLALERRVRAGGRGMASHGWTEAQAVAFAQMCSDGGFVDIEVVDDGTPRRAHIGVRARRAPKAPHPT